jgi:hypothetical protein
MAASDHCANTIKKSTVLYSNRASPNVSVDFCRWPKLDSLMRDNVASDGAANYSDSHFYIRVYRGARVNDQSSAFRIDAAGYMAIHSNHIPEIDLS